ncbi:DNA-binding transcriptional LysR family regulator [Duganella sp. 1224]|uniref:LysR family transcriptional regulator n=1 Tax=Duganella sp. 1224 TaxID=2587052 RepID=UPI0015CBCE09|nr:LysR family transcriptional regulator [Duganella sp. 1224]NYE59684.1 DNA-binding transcriptional LysR family regulator [Duganella sp. 1224]
MKTISRDHRLADPDDLRIFTLVARLSSFTLAAHHAGVPRASISHAIQRLEERLGARLLQRTTRRVHITREGEELLERAERLLDELDEIGAMFQQGADLRGRLRVDMPISMAAEVILPRVPEFLAAHPEIQLEMFSTDRRVDLIGENVDLVVRAGEIVDQTLAYRPLLTLDLLNVASPAYVRQHGQPREPGELAAHWLINYQPNPTSPPSAFEYLDAASGQAHRVPMRHKITVNNTIAYNAACRAGLGIAQLPKVRALAEIGSGAMLLVLPRHVPAPMTMNLLFPHRRTIPRRVRVFADWLAGVARDIVLHA